MWEYYQNKNVATSSKKTTLAESDPSNKRDRKAELFGLNSINWGIIRKHFIYFSANIKLLHFEKTILTPSWANYKIPGYTF